MSAHLDTLPGDVRVTRQPAAARFVSLDHWRGLACLMVVVYHSTIVYLASAPPADQQGVVAALLNMTHSLNVGVALFFVISGYCIAAAADNARRRNASVAEYFVRRVRRIYPPYWIVVLLSIALFFMFDYGWSAPLLSTEPWPQYRPWWYSASQWIGNLTLTETWRHHVAGGIRGHFPGQAWTLCYEEQFYFVTGMVLLCARRRFFTGIALVSLATVAIGVASQSTGTPVDGFFFDGSWLLFAAGVAVFYRIQYATALRARTIDLLLLALVAASAVVRLPIYGAIVGFVFAAALPWLYKFDRQVSSAAVLKPLLYCGQMCYSLYLVHQIPVKGVTMALYRAGLTGSASTLAISVPVAVAVSVVLGSAFHVAVERRFLNTSAPAPRPATEIERFDAPTLLALHSPALAAALSKSGELAGK
jgi:peptidoglycan/LPS O-acetylase OafA/YrhL